MSNRALPIKPKSPARIVAIATAKAKRSYDLSKAEYTKFWKDLSEYNQSVFSKLIDSKFEVGYLLYFRGWDHWTLITSHKLIGKIDGRRQEVQLRKIKGSDFGLVKNRNNVPLVLHVKSRFRNYQFEYESNGPGFALMVGLDFFVMHWERGALHDSLD